MKRLFASMNLAAMIFSGGIALSTTNAAAEASRPPQFVMLAFDGSQSLTMWNETRDFAKQMTAEGKPLHFTYFISGVYYVERQYKSVYTEPLKGVGVSAIGWGKDDADLEGRYDQTNLAFQEGNEIGSHVNAHFSGANWTTDQWISEFTQFDHMIFDFMEINRLQPTRSFPRGWLFTRQDMVGFRAPLLAWNKGTWEALKKFGFRYDTSQVAATNYWPKKNLAARTWNFPLADLRIAGTGKHTLSMDYNFYYTQTKGVSDPANAKLYEEQMYQTYIKYFQSNYSGNRAPVNIGHHFSKWNGGAYWNAMRRFANAVCGLPEVKCVTYRELADYMDSLDPVMITQFQRGQFPHAAAVQQLAAEDSARTYDVAVEVSKMQPGVFDMQLTGADVETLKQDPSVTIETITADGKTITGAQEHNTVSVVSQGTDRTKISLRVMKDGKEILVHTRNVSRPGQDDEKISEKSEEDKALTGDMAEAHADEYKVDLGIPQ